MSFENLFQSGLSRQDELLSALQTQRQCQPTQKTSASWRNSATFLPTTTTSLQSPSHRLPTQCPSLSVLFLLSTPPQTQDKHIVNQTLYLVEEAQTPVMIPQGWGQRVEGVHLQTADEGGRPGRVGFGLPEVVQLLSHGAHPWSPS